MLVFVSVEHLDDKSLQLAARLARDRDATVFLGEVRELPESSRHAAEERAALTGTLETAARYFDGGIKGTCIELGGDPVHGLLTLVAETNANAVVVPREPRRFWGGDALARELGTRGHLQELRVL